MQRMPYVIKRVHASDYEDILKNINMGDVVLATRYGELSNAFVSGKYKHASIYAGNNTIVEAISKGVVKTNLIDFMLSKDRVALVRAKFITSEDAAKIAMYALDLASRDIEYDYAFIPENDKFYCSEFVIHVYEKATNQMIIKTKSMIPFPNDFYTDSSNWIIIDEYGDY